MADTTTTNYGLTKPEHGKPTGWDVELNGDLDIIDSALKTNADAVALKADTSSLATVATSGSYADLSSKPSIPAAQVNSDWNASSGVAQISNKPTLATVATSGSYADLSSKPSIPAAQVNSDWNAVSGVTQISNKPTLATVATSGSYADLSSKPTIPPVIPVSPLQIGASDAGISHLGAASLAVGNGTAGDFSGAIKTQTMLLSGSTPSTFPQLQVINSDAGGTGRAGFSFTSDGGAQFGCNVFGTNWGGGLPGAAFIYAVDSTSGGTTKFLAFASSAQGISGGTTPIYFLAGGTSAPARMGLLSTGVFVLGGTGNPVDGNIVNDTGISRLGAASLAVGNGTAGDTTGSITLANLILSAPQSPASNAAGTAGQLAYDANYVYVCISSGVWKRSPLTGGY